MKNIVVFFDGGLGKGFVFLVEVYIFLLKFFVVDLKF